MPVARTHSIALVGVEGHPVEIEADIQNGLPGLLLVGLPDTALREARDRIRAAIVNSREQWPQRRITVGLSPASLPKRGSGFDVGIAVAILGAAGSVPAAAIDGMAFLGELGLDGQLRPVRGVLPAAAAAAARGFRRVAVPSANEAEAALVPGLRVLSAPTLPGLLGWLRGRSPAVAAEPADQAGPPGRRPGSPAGRGSGRPRRPRQAAGTAPCGWSRAAWPRAPGRFGRRAAGRRRAPGPTWPMCWASPRPAGPRRSAPRAAIISACSARRARARRCWPSGFPPCCPASTPPRPSRSPRFTRWRACSRTAARC